MRKNATAIVFLLILIGSILLYFPPFFSQSNYYPGENFSIDLNEYNEQFEKPSWINFFRKISSPFDFKFFNLYLEPIENKALNNCSYMDMGTIYLTFENKTLSVETGEKNLIDTIRIDEYNFGSASVTYDIDYSDPYMFNCNLTVDFKTKVYVKMNIWDAFGNILILFIFYSGFFLLTLEIIKKIKKNKTRKNETKINMENKRMDGCKKEWFKR